jgi:NADP-dependent 3-hydroxy acid dehydrogenase YdfG
MSQELAGRIAVVTGASSGIGSAIATTLAARGAKVALLARRERKLAELVTEITAHGGTALGIPTDVTSKTSIDEAAAQIQKQFGTIDLLVNNAGIMLPAPVEELHTDQWQRQIDLNVSGVMNTIGSFLTRLIAATEEGRTVDLINMSSITAQYIYPNFAVYSASKAFVSHLTRHLRVELASQNIRVSLLEPGFVTTELQGHVTDEGIKAWLTNASETTQFVQPQDVADIVAFQVSLPHHVTVQQVVIMPTGMGQ